MREINKIKTLLLALVVITTITISKTYAVINDYTLLGKTIYLDAGHGGPDSGAIAGGIYEKNINLEIVKKVEKELTKKGATVYLTRDKDTDLSTQTHNRKRSDLTNRAQKINKTNPNLYLSIHLNSTSNSKWRGMQIFYTSKNKQNKYLAQTIYDEMTKNLSNVRELKQEDNYYMYKQIKVPGVLVEVGFLSNPSDNYILRDEKYQEKIARLLATSLETYFTKK